MPQTATNMPAQAYAGLNINWGLGATDYAISGVSAVFQTSDVELKYDETEVRDQRGNVKAWVGYNPTDAATLEYVVATTASAAGNAAVSYPSQGTKISITAGTDEPVSGSNWIVQSVTVRKANTDACKVSLKCIRYASV